MKETPINEAARVWLAEALRTSGRKKTELAAALGLDPSAITRMLKGERQIGLTELDAALSFFGDKRGILAWKLDRFPASDFIDAPEQMLHAITEIITGKKSDIEYTDPVSIPPNGIVEVDLSVKLPEGIRLSGEAFIGKIHKKEVIRDIWILPERIIESFGARNSKDLRCFANNGDAMFPIIQDGDVAFIEIGIDYPNNPGLYALADPFAGAIIRRLEAMHAPEGQYPDIIVSCENRRYESRVVPYSSLRVLGRLVGVFGRPHHALAIIAK